MGFLAQAVRQPLNRAFDEPLWGDLLSAFRSKSNQNVNVTSALGVMSVLGCLRVISEDVAQVSRDVFKKRADGGSDVAAQHPLRRLLVRRPNPWQTSFEFFEQLVIHTALAGRFIAFKNVVRGEIRELIPFEPGCVTPCQDPTTYAVTYKVTGKDGTTREFPAEAIWHVKGPSWNGWDGMEILKLAREAIGLSIATEESHALMHANGGQASGIYSVEGKLDSTQYKQMRDWIEKNISGLNKFRPFILDRGGKWISTAMKGVDAEHLATRNHQIEEVCRAWRVMPIMIGYSDKTATFASASEMFAAHVKYTLGGWFKRIEESVGANLLSDDDWAAGVYFKFLPVSLLRGTPKDRGEFYNKMWMVGALNPNEIRAMEELNPYDGGDQYRVPANTLPVDDGAVPGDDPTQKAIAGRRLNVGRVLSSRNERRIRDADGLLNEVLAELDNEQQE
jgi:HK97 family phage portal protein